MPDLGGPDDLERIRGLAIFHELRADLARQVAAEARRARRPWWRTRSAALGAVGALVIAAPAAAAIGGVWDPSPPAQPPASTTVASLPPTAAAPVDAVPSSGEASIPDSIRDAFAVLRRPQTDRDRRVLRLPTLQGVRGTISRDGVRMLGFDAEGLEQWIVPVVSADPAGRPTWGLAVVSSKMASGPVSVDEIAKRGSVFSREGTTRQGVTMVSGLVPDGVPVVTATYPGGSDSSREWPVENNLFSFEVAVPVDQGAQVAVTLKRSSP